jgi:hypothetical protein
MDFQTELDKIMDLFDFARVANTMELTGWVWATTGGVPSEYDLRKQARSLLKAAYEMGTQSGRGYEIATGGFYAEYDPQDSYLKLSFKITEVSNWDV